MVAVTPGRRRRPAGCAAGHHHQHQQQRLLAVAARLAAAKPAATTEAAVYGGVGGGGCCLEFLDCVLRAMGVATPAEIMPPADFRWAARPMRRRRRGGSSSSSSSPRDREPRDGRIAANGASAAASLYTMRGNKGVNQDAMLVWENFCSKEDTIFCGVFDGHGPYGHLVSKRVRDLLPIKLSANLGRDGHKETSTNIVTSSMTEGGGTERMDRDTETPLGTEENREYPEMFAALRTSLLRAFYVMDRDLKFHKTIDSVFSGTTAVTVIKQGHDLLIGNLGDSRAVLGTRDEYDQFFAVQLTVDLKPTIPSEAARIRERSGRIFSLPDEPDVARVWLPKYNMPGLAMARAFGDFCLKDYGLISMPDVSYHRITEKDEFVVLATDGVWDVLSNSEVVSIVSQAKSEASAARFVVESAQRAWRTRFPTSKIDDCAVVCLFLNTDARNKPPGSGIKDLANAIELGGGNLS
uniref:protein-serine/threonine phosphatase n=1 Tax=Oryza rufipogon TaxID=4529 RepID=A0A0E0P7B9_ORYRU